VDKEKLLAILKRSGEDPIAFTKYVLNFPYKLTSGQRQILEAVYDPRFETEVVEIVVGRKGTKSTIATIIELFEVYRVLRMPEPHWKYNLLPGQNIYCLNFAPTAGQAIGITVNYAVALTLNSWWFRKYLLNYNVKRQTVMPYDELRFPKQVKLKAMSSSSKSGRGWAVKVALLDESAWFQSTGGNQSGGQIVAAVRPNLKPFKGDGKLILISTPAGKDGMFWETFDDVVQPGRVVEEGKSQ